MTPGVPSVSSSCAIDVAQSSDQSLESNYELFLYIDHTTLTAETLAKVNATVHKSIHKRCSRHPVAKHPYLTL